MSAVGQQLWVHMQKKGPYNKSAFAEMLTRTGIFHTSHQNISNWLAKEYPPVPFVNAVATSLDLSEDEVEEIKDMYFHYGQIPSKANKRIAADIESEEGADAKGKDAQHEGQAT